MILLDHLVGYDAESLTAEVRVRPGIPFHRPGRGVPAHIGFEWMAQTCGAFVGAKARDSGQPIRVGLVLGTRNFASRVAWFVDGERLAVTARQMFNDEQMGAFECEISRSDGEKPVAKAQLTVFRPNDDAALVASTRFQAPS
jgi:predicted hotdog family 3-hydroxylacyl-ACP dehydratase